MNLGLGLGLTCQRPSRWTPLTLGSAVLAHFAPSSLTADPVATWADQAPTPHDAVQANATKRPPLSTIGSGTAAAFDGSDDWLGNADTLSFPSGKLTLAIVYQVTSTPGGGTFGGLCNFQAGATTLDVLVMNAGGYKNLSFVAGSNNMVGADVGLDTNPHRLILTWNGGSVSSPASWSLTFDGSPVTVLTSGFAAVGAGTSLGARAGGANPLAVKIAGAALLDGEADATTLALLDTWLEGLIA